jgi:hypothetical protein
MGRSNKYGNSVSLQLTSVPFLGFEIVEEAPKLQRLNHMNQQIIVPVFLVL